MIAPHAIQRHPSNAQPRLRVLHSGCRRACWAMMMRQARRSSAIQHYTVRCGFLSQRSYVAPSRQRRSSSKRPRKELTYCPIYGFKSFLICAKELTPALFCAAWRIGRVCGGAQVGRAGGLFGRRALGAAGRWASGRCGLVSGLAVGVLGAAVVLSLAPTGLAWLRVFGGAVALAFPSWALLAAVVLAGTRRSRSSIAG